MIPSLPGTGSRASRALHGLGSGPHRLCAGRADEAARLRAIRGTRGRLGGDHRRQMGVLAPPELLGIHTDLAASFRPKSWGFSRPTSSALAIRGRLVSRTKRTGRTTSWTFSLRRRRLRSGDGSTVPRPCTALQLADRAGILDDRSRRPELSRHLRAFVEKEPVGSLTRDEVLDNITLTWLTNTGVSSARLYSENKLGFFDAKGVSIPVAVYTFAREIYPCREVGPSRRTRT